VRALLLAIAMPLAGHAEPPPVYASGYFGEPLKGLSPTELAQFERGFSHFVRNWSSVAASSARNAPSCVTCHSVPMAGGAGMSNDALVPVTVRSGVTEVHQRITPAAGRVRHSTPTVRRSPALFGLGLLEAAADGRRPFFGALGEHSSLAQFVANAFAVELGVSTPTQCARRRIEDVYPSQCVAAVTAQDIEDVVAYVRFLAAPPISANGKHAGRKPFAAAGCTSCHSEEIQTGAAAPGPLRNRRIAAYTDLRWHDLGSGPVRTTALWGLNSLGPPYTHRGSAGTIREAIELHGGDASESLRRFRSLPRQDQDALLSFLKSL
jgi:hypothetical protein